MNIAVKSAVAFAVLASFAAVWHSGAARRELDSYIHGVVQVVSAVDDVATSPNVEPLADCEHRILPAYARALSAARAFRVSDPQLAAWHARFVSTYTEAEDALVAWVEAAHAGRAEAAEAAMMRFAHVNDASLSADLAKLCQLRGVTPLP